MDIWADPEQDVLALIAQLIATVRLCVNLSDGRLSIDLPHHVG